MIKQTLQHTTHKALLFWTIQTEEELNILNGNTQKKK